jgi:hypothetical protein
MCANIITSFTFLKSILLYLVFDFHFLEQISCKKTQTINLDGRREILKKKLVL